MTDMVTRVAEALENVQLFSRWNDWTSDRVEGMPIEICRHGDPDKDEIIVVRRFDRTWKEEDALRLCIKEALAVAAIKAMREPTEAMMDAPANMPFRVVDVSYNQAHYSPRKLEWQAAIDAALKEHADKSALRGEEGEKA